MNHSQPDDVPDAVKNALEASSDRQLRATIEYAQRLLGERSRLTDAIEPREGEDIVRIHDHEAYTSVIVERPEETGQAQGPFAYRVQWEPGMDDEDGHYRWHYLGRVAVDSEAD
jgi:hypothetical protein